MANLRFVDYLNTQEWISREEKVAPELKSCLATGRAAVLIPVSPLVSALPQSPFTPVQVTAESLREGSVSERERERERKNNWTKFRPSPALVQLSSTVESDPSAALQGVRD